VKSRENALVKIVDFRPLKSRFFAPNPCEAKMLISGVIFLYFVQKSWISDGSEIQFFCNSNCPWAPTVKSMKNDPEIQLFAVSETQLS